MQRAKEKGPLQDIFFVNHFPVLPTRDTTSASIPPTTALQAGDEVDDAGTRTPANRAFPPAVLFVRIVFGVAPLPPSKCPEDLHGPFSHALPAASHEHRPVDGSLQTQRHAGPFVERLLALCQQLLRGVRHVAPERPSDRQIDRWRTRGFGGDAHEEGIRAIQWTADEDAPQTLRRQEQPQRFERMLHHVVAEGHLTEEQIQELLK